MILSIVMCGRNDTFAGNFVQRLEHNLNKLIENIDSLGAQDVEIIVTDWGSPIENTLYDVTNVPKRDYLKFLFVPHELTLKYSPNSNFSIPHALNAAVRRMTGKYMLSLDGDTYVTFEMFEKIYSMVKNETRDYIFYWGSRILMPYKVQTTIHNIGQMDQLIEDWVNSGKPLVPPSQIAEGWVRSKVDVENFCGGGCAILINRVLLHECTFLYEKLTKWGWMDVEFHNRLSSKYHCMGDLEDLFQTEFFHIGHHEVEFGGNTHGFNPNLVSQNLKCNDDDWGLGNENLIFNNGN